MLVKIMEAVRPAFVEPHKEMCSRLVSAASGFAPVLELHLSEVIGCKCFKLSYIFQSNIALTEVFKNTENEHFLDASLCGNQKC